MTDQVAPTGGHRHVIRVRYAESDQMGVAHHAAYVVWFEEARIAWLRAHGHDYRALEASGVLMPVIDLQVKYRRSLRFDDEIEMATRISAYGPSRVTFTTVITCGGKECAEATVTVASMSREGRPTRLPAGLAAVIAQANAADSAPA